MWNDKDSSGERFLGWNSPKEKLPPIFETVLIKRFNYELGYFEGVFNNRQHWSTKEDNTIPSEQIIAWKYIE